MRKKLLLGLIIIMMTIVFAVGTTEVFLHGSINISDSDDFNIYFSNAIIDGVENKDLIIGKKQIVFETNELQNPSDFSNLVYEISNNSRQYDANVIVSCSSDNDDIVNIVLEPSEINIESGTKKTGKIKVNSKKYVVDKMSAKITCELNVIPVERDELGSKVDNCSYEVGYTWEFDHVGKNDFIVPCDGEYKLEVWGAQGGGIHLESNLGVGGNGGYSKGIINLESNDRLYAYVGGTGSYCDGNICNIEGGFNGGGGGAKLKNQANDPAASGGGATDFRLISGNWNDAESLLSRIIVAGGGGGGGMDNEAGGAGGGIYGITTFGAGGKQTSGFAFGYGCTATSTTADATHGGPGGGGGWYGGSCSSWKGAGGGSGFVLTKNTVSNTPTDYSVTEDYYLSSAKTIAGNLSMPTHDGLSTMIGNSGDGYAKITFLGDGDANICDLLVNNDWDFDTVGEEEFRTPCIGTYKLEVWGAQGGSSVSGSELYNGGGLGGYATGTINLSSKTSFYINVGGKGTDAYVEKIDGNWHGDINAGGYNGGGFGTWDNNDDEASGGGGGATHIAYVSGVLADIGYNNKDKILIVAGGGGGQSYTFSSGSGGGYKGGVTSSTSSAIVDQENGYAFGKGENGHGVGDSDGVGGGGGGFYGGFANDVNRMSSGSGGSGYLNPILANKVMYCYNCSTSDDENIKTINTSYSSDLPISNYAKKGNGYVRITYLG